MSPTLTPTRPPRSGFNTSDTARPSRDQNSAEESESLPGEADQPPAATIMLPAELLQPGEIIVLLIKPSAWYIVLDALGSLVGITLITIAAVMSLRIFNLNVAPRDLVLTGIGLLGLRLFWQFLEWLSRVYVLTDRRVIRVAGVFTVSVFEAPLKRIQHTVAQYSVRERLFGLGSIGFATAGTDRIEASWRMIARPLEVHQIVVRTLDRYR